MPISKTPCHLAQHPTFQQEVLNQVTNHEISLDEMKKKASDFRSLEHIRKAFTKYTNSTWEEAVERYPWHTKEERLNNFLGLDFIKNVPESFQSYCQAAVRGEQQQESTLFHKGAVARVHTMNVMELSIDNFMADCPSYTGAHLILTDIPKVCM